MRVLRNASSSLQVMEVRTSRKPGFAAELIRMRAFMVDLLVVECLASKLGLKFVIEDFSEFVDLAYCSAQFLEFVFHHPGGLNLGCYAVVFGFEDLVSATLQAVVYVVCECADLFGITSDHVAVVRE
jgi:hypothetical protein